MKKILFVLFFSIFLTFPYWESWYKSHLPANVQKRAAENRKNTIAQPSAEQKNKKQSTDFLIVGTGVVLLLLFFNIGFAYLDIDEKYLKKVDYDGDSSGGLDDGGLE